MFNITKSLSSILGGFNKCQKELELFLKENKRIEKQVQSSLDSIKSENKQAEEVLDNINKLLGLK